MSWRINLNDLVAADKIRASKKLPPHYSMYDPNVCRVIDLENVGMFTLTEKPNEETEELIVKQGFFLSDVDEGYYTYRKRRNV